jgi:hypothetical protein
MAGERLLLTLVCGLSGRGHGLIINARRRAQVTRVGGGMPRLGDV